MCVMSAPMSADAFLRCLKAEGLTVVQVGDWPSHNRNHKGPWGEVHGVMIHHTVTEGTTKTVRIVRDGYSGLPGPLCHGMIAKDGRVHLVGYGRTNHAGLGDDDVLRAVIAERGLPADNEANTDGNRHFYGFECENLGDGEDPWPAVQLEAIEKAAAAVCRYHNWGGESVIGHLEWQPGKVDPRGFTMLSMRTRVHERLKLTKPIKPLPKPVQPKVSLSKLIRAAKTEPAKRGTPKSYYAGVKIYEAALVDEGLLAKKRLDGHFGSDTQEATSDWQERCGFHGRKPGQDADGIPGRISTGKLAKKHGFTVTK